MGVPTSPAQSLQGRVPVTCPPGFQSRYIVQPGDTMFSIAQRSGVSLDALIAANPHIPDPNVLFPGDVLCVRVACPPGAFLYTVQPGDTLFLIAQRFGTTVDAIVAINPQMTNPNLIFPGEAICVPLPPVRECCLILTPVPSPGGPPVPTDARGMALVRPVVQTRPGRIAISVAAHDLPAPSTLGTFDAYEAAAAVFMAPLSRWQLFSTPAPIPTWAGTFTEIRAFSSNGVIVVRPVNTQTNVPGPDVLLGALANCAAS